VFDYLDYLIYCINRSLIIGLKIARNFILITLHTFKLQLGCASILNLNRMAEQKRNLLLTKTALGIYVSFTATLLAVSPNIESLIVRGKTDTDKANLRDALAIVFAVVGATGAMAGRNSAGGVYTPKYFPGEDPEDSEKPL
jgi:hypothetical protein